ncbi:hypothetical protein NIES4071_90520 [Calothrix sp. NIES-4071]|nr:hypothetical protein NIES4071_90520 [Calothrix sp. NIES-4071]BAZ63319.1 hypothetical protein NIES4105_90450 [Calothrix sp. NIES-4105]
MNNLVAITFRHWKWLFAFNLLVGLGAFSVVTTSKPVWTSTTQLILPKTTSHLDASLGTLGTLKNDDPGFSSELNPLNVQASILTSETLLEQVLAVDPEKDKFKTISSFKGLFKVSPQEQSTIMSLTVNASSPQLATKRADNLVQAYQTRLNELRTSNSQARQQYSQKELQLAKNKLDQANIKIARFKQSTGIVDDTEQIKGIVTTINTLTTSHGQALAAAKAGENRVQALSQRLSLAPESAVRSLGLGENPEFKLARQKLAEINAALLEKQALFTDEHPQVSKLLGQRSFLLRQLRDDIQQASQGVPIDPNVATDAQGRATLIQQLILAESETLAARGQAQQLALQINQLQTGLNSLPAKQAKLSELQRQLDVAEGVYKGLVAQVQQNNIDAFDAYPNVQVLDAPKVGAKPTSPKLLLIVINTLLASLAGSIALVLLLESRNPLLSPKDLQDQKFPIVEDIPRIRNSARKSEVAPESEVEFQRLASAISLQPLENKRLLVTSASVGEGKTTVALGLANALVDLGFRVLLVDGDFHQAALSRRLGYNQQLKEESTTVSIQPNLDLLPTLPKQGKIVEMIRRGRFEKTLTNCQTNGNYDYIIVDSAPVTLTSETPLLTTIIRNVLFVVRPDTSYRDLVNRSFAQLTQHKGQILGLVVNGVENNSRPYSYKPDTSKINS